LALRTHAADPLDLRHDGLAQRDDGTVVELVGKAAGMEKEVHTMQTVDLMIPILTLLATSGGAGWAASRLFDWLRTQIPRPTAAEWHAAPWLARQGWALLWSPALARPTAFVLAATLAALASGLLAWLTGRDALVALDAALAVVISQIVHIWGLPMTPTMEPPDDENETAAARPVGA
jgi:hypothetical protein